jgi:hypothetical protein
MVHSWHAETVTILIKVLPVHEIASLELRVREFKPSVQFQPYIYSRSFDDKLGLLPSRTVRTRPYAIPYTHYVECGRLEMWARESLRWKLENVNASVDSRVAGKGGLWEGKFAPT